MKKRRVMLDGALIGTELMGSIELKKSETQIMDRLLRLKGATEEAGALCYTVEGRSNMVVSLKRHYHDKKRYYLNISGNPLTFLKGSNTYGYVEADIVMVKAYRRALKSLDGVPNRILELVKNRDINIHSLEFATYTNPVKNKKQLLNDWRHMYQSAYSTVDGLTHETLSEILGLKHERLRVGHTSVCLKILSPDRREEEAMLMAYDKALELKGKGKKVPEDIEKRVRIELCLTQGWFRRRQVDKKKIKTLRQLVRYIEVNYKSSWLAFIRHEFDKYIAKAYLFEMWALRQESMFANIPKMEQVILINRARMRITDEQWHFIIEDQRVPKFNLNPHPEVLKLDMGLK